MTQLIFGSATANRILAGMRLEFRVWDGLDFICDSCGEQGPVADVCRAESWRSICAYCYDEEANEFPESSPS